MAETLRKVKADLGPEAVILHTRTVRRGGVFGVGGRTIVEITATRDRAALAVRQRRGLAGFTTETVIPPDPVESPGRCDESHAPRSDRQERPRPLVAGIHQHVRSAPRNDAHHPDRHAFDPALADLQGQMAEIRGMVRELLGRPTDPGAAGNAGERVPPPPAVPEELQEYYTRLLQQAVAEELAREIVARARNRLAECRDRIRAGVGGRGAAGPVDDRIAAKLRELVPAVLMESIERMLPSAAPLEVDAREAPKVVALVGPTGVGKTTTVAKLAAHFKLRESKRVGLITIDTYRIAAVDQLRAYAEIMDLPLEVVLAPDELPAALARLDGCDLILIDTSGRSHRDARRLNELRTFVESARRAVLARVPGDGGEGASPDDRRPAAPPFEVHLLLSCTCQPEQLIAVAERFAGLGIDAVVFTKLDEAVGLGVVLNVAARLKCQMSYLTTGQDVPHDIEVGHRRRIAEMLLAGDAVELARDRSPDRSMSSIEHVA